jgi:ABC-type nitrate/sulfonate/bicarbonate transport system permease component
MGKLVKNREKWVLGAGTVILFFVVWEVVSKAKLVNPLFLSSPSQILKEGYSLFSRGELTEHIKVSTYEFLLGYVLSAVIGIPLGMIAGWYKRINYMLSPFLSALYSTPMVALLPLIILWVGIGIWSKVLIIFLGAFFPIMINTMSGVQMIDHKLLEAAHSFGADDRRLFKTIIFPSSVPFIITGLRLGVARGLVSIIVGELYAANAGIGYFIILAGTSFQTTKVFVGVLLFALSGVLLVALLSRLERRFERWRPKVGART